MTDGVCPFAEQIAGVTTFQSGYTDRVGFADHAAGGFLNTMRDPSFWASVGTSVHFAIGRDGEIIQMVNIFDTAWAQGKLGPTQSWPPFATMGRQNPNGYLISTEHADWESVNGVSHAVPGSQWTPEEYAADLRVKRWCVEEVRRVTGKDLMRFGLDSLAGHHMFDSVNRAECPGKFWRDVYRGQIYSQLMGEKPVGGNDVATERYDGELNNARALKAVMHNLMLTTPVHFDPADPHTAIMTDLQGVEKGRLTLEVLPDYDAPN